MLPTKIFLSETNKYSKFDENGIPTHDAQGNDLSDDERRELYRRIETSTSNSS
jgi:cysteinyl-tRNA synthetase